MKQADKDLSKIFFNSVEEMNECYGVDADLPSNLYSNADLVCYEIVEPFVCDYLGQYVFTEVGFHHLDGIGEPVIYNDNEITLESEVYEDDATEWDGRCFVYVRVNEYLRKHLEKTLIGCEFICMYGSKSMSERRFVESVEIIEVETFIKHLFVTDQDGYSVSLTNILLYPDDHSDPIPYQEWVKQINKKDVEVEDKQDTPLYSKFSTVVASSFKEHEYRKVDTKYRKGYKRLASGESYCLESEDIGLFIPIESSKQYEDTLQKVIQKALTVEWIPKFSEH